MRRQYKPKHYKNILINTTKKKNSTLKKIIDADEKIIELERLLENNDDKAKSKIKKANKKINELIANYFEMSESIAILEKSLFEKHLLSKYKK